MSTLDDRAAWQKAAERATNGPWIVEVGGYTGTDWLICSCGNARDDKNRDVTTDHLHASESNGADADDDARFIALSREAVPALLSDLAAAEGRVKELEAQNARYRDALIDIHTYPAKDAWSTQTIVTIDEAIGV